MNLALRRSVYCWPVCFCLTRVFWVFAPGLVILGVFPPPVSPKLIGGLGLSFTGFSAGAVFFPGDADGAVVLAV